MATHSSTLAWKIPWTEEPGGLQSMGSLRVGHDWATSLSRIGKGNGNPLQCSCLENPRNGGAWWAPVYGVAQSWTRLRWLSSSSSLNDRGLRILSLQDKLLLSRNSKRFSEWGNPSWRNYEWSWSAGSVMCGAFIPRDLPQPPPVILSMDITQAIFSNHNAMMLEMNYKKKNY